MFYDIVCCFLLLVIARSQVRKLLIFRAFDPRKTFFLSSYLFLKRNFWTDDTDLYYIRIVFCGGNGMDKNSGRKKDSKFFLEKIILFLNGYLWAFFPVSIWKPLNKFKRMI